MNKMETKKRSTINRDNLVSCGIFILILTAPFLIVMIKNPTFSFFTYSFGYIVLDLLILAITSFISAYFFDNPPNSRWGKKFLSLIGMILGVVLTFLPIVIISSNIYSFYFYYGQIYITFLLLPPGILAFILLFLGIAIFVHSWFLKELLMSEEKRTTANINIKEKNIIIGLFRF